MTLFDRYIAVDWSAANMPRLGKDSIWVAEWGKDHHPGPTALSPGHTRESGDLRLVGRPANSDSRFRGNDPVPSYAEYAAGQATHSHPGGRGRLLHSLNPPTRAAAMTHLLSRLRWALERGERVFVGCDFGFGYPAGTASALTGAADWQGVWALIADLMVDADDNANNRFAVAERLNARLGEPLFWGHPHQHRYEQLTPRRPTHGYPQIAERRAVESLSRSAQPMFKLSGVGSVGSQSLTGIARLERLRTAPSLAGQIAVWPFETGFAGPVERSIWLVEMYPSLFPLAPDAPAPKDRAQVEAAAAGFAALDARGQLPAFLSPPPGTSDATIEVARREEGWIAGVGRTSLLGLDRRVNYLRDPAAIYAQSFATIRAEALLGHLPTTLHEVAIRMIHACGMVDIAGDITGDEQLPSAVRGALLSGAPVFCDCEMVRSGIIRRSLPENTELVMTLNDPQVPALAQRLGTTRSAAAVELWRDRLAGAVVVIGNAPTALFHLLEMIEAGGPVPAAVIATPVGFVGAAESKALLAGGGFSMPFVTVRGRRGGSAIASAAFNAIGRGLEA